MQEDGWIVSFSLILEQEPTQQLRPHRTPVFRRAAQLAPMLILQYIFDRMETNQQGQPPASASIIDSLPVIQLTERRRSKHRSCAICLEDFKMEDEKPIVRLPCHHLYHKDCISQWLKNSATCPHCRYELPTNNEDYNRGVEERMHERNRRLRMEHDTDDEQEQPRYNLRPRKKQKRTL
ncbi:hypothetical protein EDD86DRAFT_237826, partial [Gorgonomyces haynaldii]